MPGTTGSAPINAVDNGSLVPIKHGSSSSSSAGITSSTASAPGLSATPTPSCCNLHLSAHCRPKELGSIVPPICLLVVNTFANT